MEKIRHVSNLLIAIVFGILVILFWQEGGLHAVLRLKPYQLPLPKEIIAALVDNFAVIMVHTRYTMIEALTGIILGSCAGFLLAVITTVYPKWGGGGLTLVTAFNAIPMIAMAPIMNNWFGMDMGSKTAVVTMFTMAPMAINAYRGLSVLRPFALDLMHSYAADKKTIFLKLRLPNCIPNVMTAMKINTTVGLMAAIISEFFVSHHGIGFELSTVLKLSQMSLGWAYIVDSAICGIMLYGIVSVVERYAIKWHASQR
ncbi:ABC transporter permease [Sporomusa sp. KB1]|jgi:NitT/TauT family transport system permease protein|uniref:ABC transporter permease n=1 Tax=Sporomusa sp. KB1 TaxID=943346 RepID=UPI0011ADEA6A|nr:ABC transporter permease subunit [Sporomusa sp. KB1]TWH47916.1 NitT/TauT family transport system permease protein [Sporomusa sp. KB1]